MADSNSPKSYSVTHETRTGYLYVCVQGETNSLAIAREYWSEFNELCRQTESDRILVEKDIPQNLEISELFTLGTEIAAMGFKDVKVALYDPHTLQSTNEFGEMVTTTRGMDLKTFKTAAAAETWLLSD